MNIHVSDSSFDAGGGPLLPALRKALCEIDSRWEERTAVYPAQDCRHHFFLVGAEEILWARVFYEQLTAEDLMSLSLELSQLGRVLLKKVTFAIFIPSRKDADAGAEEMHAGDPLGERLQGLAVAFGASCFEYRLLRRQDRKTIFLKECCSGSPPAGVSVRRRVHVEAPAEEEGELVSCPMPATERGMLPARLSPQEIADFVELGLDLRKMRLHGC